MTPPPPDPTLLYAQRPKSVSGLAIASLVLGILAIPLDIVFFAGSIFGLLAIIFGTVAIFGMRTQPKTGKAMAIVGIILGTLAILLALGCAAMMFVPSRYMPNL